MKLQNKARIGAAVLASASICFPSTARASALTIDDTSDQIIVRANDFEFGSSLNGAPFQQGLGNPASAIIPESAGPITFHGQWIDFGQGAPASGQLFFVEPSDQSTVSDILTWEITRADSSSLQIDLTFVSDFENNLGTVPPGANILVEGPGAVARLSAVGFGAEFRSDAETQVPDGGSMATLLGIALTGIGAMTRKFRRA